MPFFMTMGALTLQPTRSKMSAGKSEVSEGNSRAAAKSLTLAKGVVLRVGGIAGLEAELVGAHEVVPLWTMRS